ncbi:MAG: hypothetical protein R3C56_41510 [Pirellulaceae bacterium]
MICGSLGILASVNGHYAEAAIAFAFSGALLGFLVFNFPPPRFSLATQAVCWLAWWPVLWPLFAQGLRK